MTIEREREKGDPNFTSFQPQLSLIFKFRHSTTELVHLLRQFRISNISHYVVPLVCTVNKCVRGGPPVWQDYRIGIDRKMSVDRHHLRSVVAYSTEVAHRAVTIR